MADNVASSYYSVWAVAGTGGGDVIPEPSTLAIWSLLTVCGLTVVSWRRRK